MEDFLPQVKNKPFASFWRRASKVSHALFQKGNRRNDRQKIATDW